MRIPLILSCFLVACALECDNEGCAPRNSASCGLLGIETLAALVPWAWSRKRRQQARRCGS